MVWRAIKCVPVACVNTVCGPSFVLKGGKRIPVTLLRSICQGSQRIKHHVVLCKRHYSRLIPQSLYSILNLSLSWIKPGWIYISQCGFITWWIHPQYIYPLMKSPSMYSSIVSLVLLWCHPPITSNSIYFKL